MVFGFSRIFSIAVRLLLLLLGATAGHLPATNDATVAITYAGANTAQNLAILISPFPDAVVITCEQAAKFNL